jgi:subtilisin family serine protease
MREYNVILKKDVDYDSFWNDMESDTDGGKLYIPNRAVEYTNERPTSLRQCWYRLTDEEAELVRGDDRVLAVEIPPEHRDDIQIGLHGVIGTPQLYEKTNSNSGPTMNWGLVRGIRKENIFGANSVPPIAYEYILDGTGVDVVIQDSGLQVDHPEFEDFNDNSRVQQINWYTVSGVAGSQSANHYRDFDGHGTHVAGIAAGKYYGWAKNSKIYSQKLAGLEGSGDSSTGISTTDAFDTIKGWHASKSGSRPTIVNMSWGYLRSYTSVSAIHYRGTSYTGVDIDTVSERFDFGLIPYTLDAGVNYITNVRVPSVDADIEEMIDAGIVVVIAAGNRSHKIDVVGGVDYNNSASLSSGVTEYCRGSSPSSPRAFIVGSIDDDTDSPAGGGGIVDKKAEYSERGDGVDIYAPGSAILSACSTTYDTVNFAPQNYQANNDGNASFKQMNIQGTSMAAPQVAGVAALVAQVLNPSVTSSFVTSSAFPAAVKSFILNNSSSSLYFTNTDDDFSDLRSTLSTNAGKVLYNPHSGKEPIRMSGTLSFAGVGLEFR